MTELCYGREFDEKETCGYRLVRSKGRTVCLSEQTPHEKVWIRGEDGRERAIMSIGESLDWLG